MASGGLRRALLRMREAAEDVYTGVRADFAPLASLELFSFSSREDALLAASRAWALARAPAAVAALDAAGWWVGSPLIDTAPQRRLSAHALVR